MFRILVRYLEARTSDTPFFLTLSTIETHLASDTSPGHRQYGDGRNPVLNVFHQLDRGFGHFWQWFKRSEYAHNAIVVLTGDHAMLPRDALRQVAGPAFRNHRFDYMALFIRDPTHDLPASFRANTTSIDFTPSLLQLLGIQELPNAFLGLSMFSDRPQVRPGFAFAWGRDLTDWNLIFEAQSNEEPLVIVQTYDCSLECRAQLDLLNPVVWRRSRGGRDRSQVDLLPDQVDQSPTLLCLGPVVLTGFEASVLLAVVVDT